MAKLIFVLLLTCVCSLLCQTIQVQNNQIISASLSSSTDYYYFTIPSQTQLLPTKPNIYLSITSCNILGLRAYLSASSNITLPQDGALLNNINGLITWSSNHSVSQIWIAVSSNQTDVGTYEIGISTQQSMHLIYNSTESTVPSMTLDDTDANNALFLSNPLSSTLPNNTLIITSNQPAELSFSQCAAKLYALSNISVNQTMTTRGPTNATRYQLFASGLTQSSTYQAYLFQTNDGLTGMTMPIAFKTKASSVCQLIYDLPFCDQVAYSVAANDMDRWSLASQYDTQASNTFEPFALSLSQFNCDSTQYSLVRNCTDCYRDYKAWLCAVTIPRCTDTFDVRQGTIDSVAPAIRDVLANGSRNPWVDSTLGPADSTELLPCIDLCYHVVQSCPPYMQFFCPTGDLANSQYGYWQTGKTTVNNTVYSFDVNQPTCNRMGLDTKLLTITSGGHRLEMFSYSLYAILILILL